MHPIARVAVQPLEPLARVIQGGRIPCRCIDCRARLDGICGAVGVLGLGLEPVAASIEAVKPAAGVVVPQHVAQIAKAVERRGQVSRVVGIGPAGVGGGEGLTRLKLEELVVRTARGPASIEVAEKAARLVIQRARKPRLEHVAPKD